MNIFVSGWPCFEKSSYAKHALAFRINWYTHRKQVKVVNYYSWQLKKIKASCLSYEVISMQFESIWSQLSILKANHTAQKSPKRMNRAQISSLVPYIRDLRISSFFWRGTSVAVHRISTVRDSRFWTAQNSASRTGLRSNVLFYVIFGKWAKYARDIDQRSFAKMLPLSRSSATFHRWLADIWRMFHACNTYVSLKKILWRESCAIHSPFISDSEQIVRDFPWNIRHAQPCIRLVWGLCVLNRRNAWFVSDLSTIFP
jgi:hypothetical protein